MAKDLKIASSPRGSNNLQISQEERKVTAQCTLHIHVDFKDFCIGKLYVWGQGSGGGKLRRKADL